MSETQQVAKEGGLQDVIVRLKGDLDEERRAHLQTKQQLTDLTQQFDDMLNDMNDLQKQVIEYERKTMVELEVACNNLELDDRLKTTEQELMETRRQLHELSQLHDKCHTLLEVEQQRYYKKAYNNQQSAEQTRCMQLEKDKEVEVERIRHYKNQLAAEQARCMQLEKDKVRLVQDNNDLCSQLEELENSTPSRSELLEANPSAEGGEEYLPVGSAVMAKVQKGPNAPCWQEGTTVATRDLQTDTYKVEYYDSTFEHVATTCVVPFLDTIPPTSYFKKGDIAIAWRRVPNQIHLGNWFSVCIVDVSHDTNTVKVTWVDKQEWPTTEVELDKICPMPQLHKK